MLKKTFITLLIINFALFVWQSILGISLSTQGEILNDKLTSIQKLQNEIDVLESQVSLAGNLERVNTLASERGFIAATFIHFAPESLAQAVK